MKGTVLNIAPNPLKEYYIAYFDILGYREFFKTQPEKVPELLNVIHNAVKREKEHISNANRSPILSQIGLIEINEKIFSDNFLLCMEVLDSPFEQVRFLAFLQIVADIQRGFVNDYGLFVRGGICKGQLSFNENYVFGEGLIKAVEIEEKEAQYPRIVISGNLIEYFRKNVFYTQDDLNQATEIEKRIDNKKEVSADEQLIYDSFKIKMKMYISIMQIMNYLLFPCADEKYMLCYLNNIDLEKLWGNQLKSCVIDRLKQYSPLDYSLVSVPSPQFEGVLNIHKTRVEDNLKKYGNNRDIETQAVSDAEQREKILRKYIWIMAFHNDICDYYQKTDLKILTKCNCDRRFVKTTIEVLE